jgi:Bacterial transcriptional regulator/IclR helix-turn-helix domain
VPAPRTGTGKGNLRALVVGDHVGARHEPRPLGFGEPGRAEAQQHRRGDRTTDGAADRRGVLPVLEERRVLRVPVVAGHAEADADLQADGHGGQQRVPVGAGGHVVRQLMCFTNGEPELGVTDIAQRLELPKSAVHRVLEALTLHDRADLERVLAADRGRGYTDSSGERDPYAAAVAAPIVGRDARAFACLSVCGPRDRLDEAAREARGPVAVAAAEKISELLRGS